MNSLKKDTEKRIISILKEISEATTSEIVELAMKEDKDCKDRIPGALVALRENNLIKRRLSKEKRAVIWSMV